MPNLMGKRYECETCHGQVMCTKPGEGEVKCCGKPMKGQEPKPLPSAD